jgi:hypothetical protein
LSYANPRYLLFFRGQDQDFQNRAGGSTLYPAIYRGDNLAHEEIAHRFDQLDRAARILVDRLRGAGLDGHRDVQRKKYIQWSILQHYEVVPTPLLDVTHSLRVACSFAQYLSADPRCFIYVLGLPYISNRISLNSEEDVVNVRLLSICPPDALRPYFQEGYMVGTPDTTSDFDTKTDLDVRNRLVAKFEIPRAASRFWGADFSAIPRNALYPTGDRMVGLCSGVREEAQRSEAMLHQAPQTAPDVGDFLVEWSRLEQWLLENARSLSGRNIALGKAIDLLAKHRDWPNELVQQLHDLRHRRNRIVHHPQWSEPADIAIALRLLREALSRLPQVAAQQDLFMRW